VGSPLWIYGNLREHPSTQKNRDAFVRCCPVALVLLLRTRRWEACRAAQVVDRARVERRADGQRCVLVQAVHVVARVHRLSRPPPPPPASVSTRRLHPIRARSTRTECV
jgi:hypothetical protein